MNYFTLPIELDKDVKLLLQDTVTQCLKRDEVFIKRKETKDTAGWQYYPILLAEAEHKYKIVRDFLQRTIKIPFDFWQTGVAWTYPGQGLEYHVDDRFYLKAELTRLTLDYMKDYWPEEYAVDRKCVLFFPLFPNDLSCYAPLHFPNDDEYVTTAATCYVGNGIVEHGVPYSPYLRASLQLGFTQPIEELYELHEKGELLNV